MSIQPLGDRILVKLLDQEETTKGGIILPDVAKEKPQEGKIVAVGKGRLMEDGSTKAFEVKVGDKVLFAKFSGTEVNRSEAEYLIVKEEDILAVVQAKAKESK